MKRVANIYIFVLVLSAAVITAPAQDRTLVAREVTRSNDAIRIDVERNIREYTARREAIEGEMPKLPKSATAEQIKAHKETLLKRVLADRVGVKRGTIFTPEAERLIRSIVIAQYPKRDRLELRKELAAAENKQVPIKVNGVYPESAELMEMPPPLLLALPDLPKQVRYRFVGQNLLIVDRENHLIVDYMTNALP